MSVHNQQHVDGMTGSETQATEQLDMGVLGENVAEQQHNVDLQQNGEHHQHPPQPQQQQEMMMQQEEYPTYYQQGPTSPPLSPQQTVYIQQAAYMQGAQIGGGPPPYGWPPPWNLDGSSGIPPPPSFMYGGGVSGGGGGYPAQMAAGGMLPNYTPTTYHQPQQAAQLLPLGVAQYSQQAADMMAQMRLQNTQRGLPGGNWYASAQLSPNGGGYNDYAPPVLASQYSRRRGKGGGSGGRGGRNGRSKHSYVHEVDELDEKMRTAHANARSEYAGMSWETMRPNLQSMVFTLAGSLAVQEKLMEDVIDPGTGMPTGE